MCTTLPHKHSRKSQSNSVSFFCNSVLVMRSFALRIYIYIYIQTYTYICVYSICIHIYIFSIGIPSPL